MEKYMKTIGIIGGFGPEATAQFYLQLIDACRKVSHGTQPHIILRNVSVPSVLEHDALLRGSSINKFIPFLTRAAKDLERSGAGLVVMPCNTLHIHEKKIRSAIAVPFVSIVNASVARLRKEKIKRAGILGSRITVKQNLFRGKAPDITFVSVNAAIQKNINSGLDLFVATSDNTMLNSALQRACIFLKQHDIHHILVACTDFHGLCPVISGIRIHDTLDILVEATVNML
jgi:aspartate racemase